MSDIQSSGVPTFDALSSDYDRCAQQIHSDDSQFWRRTLVRTVFSMFEAMNSILKEKATEAACSGDKKSFNATRIELLGDYSYRILKSGKLEQEPRKAPFLHYTAFILRSLSEESYAEPTFFSENGWNEFQNTAQVRHRITHPKQDTDMEISDDELKSLDEAVRWYFNATIKAMGNDSFWSHKLPNI